jgi:threonine aldolase
LGLEEEDALERIRAQGVLISATKPGTLRAVTHLDLSDDDVDRALELVPRALGAHVRV